MESGPFFCKWIALCSFFVRMLSFTLIINHGERNESSPLQFFSFPYYALEPLIFFGLLNLMVIRESRIGYCVILISKMQICGREYHCPAELSHVPYNTCLSDPPDFIFMGMSVRHQSYIIKLRISISYQSKVLIHI